MQISLWQGIKFSGYIAKSEIAGSYVSSIIIFLRNQFGNLFFFLFFVCLLETESHYAALVVPEFGI